MSNFFNSKIQKKMGLADKLRNLRESKSQQEANQAQQNPLLYQTSNVVRPPISAGGTPAFVSLQNPALANGYGGNGYGIPPQNPQLYSASRNHPNDLGYHNGIPPGYVGNPGIVGNPTNPIHPINPGAGAGAPLQKTQSAKLEDIQMFGLILAYLQRLVSANQLQAFYSPASIDQLARNLVNRVSWRDIQKLTDIPTMQTLVELSGLALYNIVILIDNSTSMTRPGRKNELENLVSEIVEIARLFDDDGVDIRVFNDNQGATGGNGLLTMEQVSDVIQRVQYSRGTPIGQVIKQKVLEDLVYPLESSNQLSKPVLVICITDGEPDDEKDVFKAIQRGRSHLAKTRYGPKAVVYEFCQVGNDENARQFLSRIDNSKDIGDVVDATSRIENEEAEFTRNPKNRGKTFSYYNWILKLLLGAVDPVYDAQDDD